MIKKTKYFVVSLPRTGTSSVSKMAHIVGLRQKHCPSNYFLQILESDNFDFFSDTPIYTPSTIDIICADEEQDVKFIFIDRDFDEIFKSWVKVNLYGNYLGIVEIYQNNRYDMSASMLFDYESYTEAFGGRVLDETNYNSIFSEHKQTVINKIIEYERPLLIYNFESGWKPFCDFVGVDVPNVEIPVINKNRMFEPIV